MITSASILRDWSEKFHGGAPGGDAGPTTQGIGTMTKLGLLGASALGSAAFIGLTFAAASPAYAQGAQPTDCSTLPTQAERDACTAGTPPTTATPETNEPG